MADTSKPAPAAPPPPSTPPAVSRLDTFVLALLAPLVGSRNSAKLSNGTVVSVVELAQATIKAVDQAVGL